MINYTLIPVLGIEGASLATLCGYIISDIVCIIVLCRMQLMILRSRFLIAVLLMAAFFIIWRVFISDNLLFGILLAVGLVIIYFFMYKSEIRKFFKQR